MLLRQTELNFNYSILGRMHSECILCILGRMHSEIFRMHSLLKPITKNQDSPKTPETKTKNQEPRFAQESWVNLGSWFLVWVRTRSLGGILVLGLKSKIPKRLDKECILNAFLQPRTKNQDSPKTPEQILVLGSWL